MSLEPGSQKSVVITGAFSYTGKYVTRLLLSRDYHVRTLTSHPRQDVFGGRVQVFPYNFDNPGKLLDSLRGASILINTYWVRFPHGDATFELAVRNTKMLIEAAKQAGIERIVHVSIANPSLESPLGYYRGKAQLEQAVIDSGMSHAIVRPTVIFGAEDILINNIAWFVRKFPVFAIPGDGQYQIRPIYVEDMASLLVGAAERRANEVIDAVGPETFTFDELVRAIAEAAGKSSNLWHVPAAVAYAATKVMGWVVGDVILTREEYKGLMDGLLAPKGSATGATRFSSWLAKNAATIGSGYTSEVARHYKEERNLVRA